MEVIFKYFLDPNSNAEFTEQNCEICGSSDQCLEGVYFDNDLESVCLECLVKGRASVSVPDYLVSRLSESLSKNVHDKEGIEELVRESVDELSKTPPVPWIQYNDWPVCCGDFARYVGEWDRKLFSDNSSTGDGKGDLLTTLDDFSRSKVSDINVLWSDLGENTAAFVFCCLKCECYTTAVQSY